MSASDDFDGDAIIGLKDVLRRPTTDRLRRQAVADLWYRSGERYDFLAPRAAVAVLVPRLCAELVMCLFIASIGRRWVNAEARQRSRAHTARLNAWVESAVEQHERSMVAYISQPAEAGTYYTPPGALCFERMEEWRVAVATGTERLLFARDTERIEEIRGAIRRAREARGGGYADPAWRLSTIETGWKINDD